MMGHFLNDSGTDKAHASLVLSFCGIVVNVTSQAPQLIITLPSIARCSRPHHWNDGQAATYPHLQTAHTADTP